MVDLGGLTGQTDDDDDGENGKKDDQDEDEDLRQEVGDPRSGVEDVNLKLV